MEWFTLPSRPLRAFGSHGVRLDQAAVVTSGEGLSIYIAHFEPGGIIGRHPTLNWQLFAILAGSGFVSGKDLGSWPISEGQAVLWEPGEEHQATASHPMVVLIVQAQSRESLEATLGTLPTPY